MIRQIIEINKELCNGCGACASACKEGAIAMVDGKATLMRDDYCDGLGNCLPACPTGAITFIQREADAYDEAAVELHMKQREAEAEILQKPASENQPIHTGCPGSMAKTIQRESSDGQPVHTGCPGSMAKAITRQQAQTTQEVINTSQLNQWPVQIKLLPVKAPYYENANLLIAADCTAYAYGNFHRDFIRNHITMVGCPKLDEGDYTEKLTEIIAKNNIRSVTIVRMEVPCCGGLERAAKTALQNSGKFIPWQVVTISTEGEIL